MLACNNFFTAHFFWKYIYKLNTVKTKWPMQRNLYLEQKLLQFESLLTAPSWKCYKNNS